MCTLHNVHIHTFLQNILDCRIICNCEYIRFFPHRTTPTDFVCVCVLLKCVHMCRVCTFPWAAAR